MHREPRDFVRNAIVESGFDPRGKRVVEFGSYNMNGSVREFFKGAAYVGVDWRGGPGVDVVRLAHEYCPSTPFDAVVCTQMLEHDPHAALTLERAVWLVREGGFLFFTWAGPGTEPHELETAPPAPEYPESVENLVLTEAGEPAYYANLTTTDVANLILKAARGLGLGVVVHEQEARGGLDALLWARVLPPVAHP